MGGEVDNAKAAESLIAEVEEASFEDHAEGLTPDQRISLAYVHATLAGARATERLAYAQMRGVKVLEAIQQAEADQAAASPAVVPDDDAAGARRTS